MFSTRRSSFAEPSKQSGPMGVMLGLTAAAIIIFVIGVFVGRSMPHTADAPFALGEPVAPFATGAADVPAVADVDVATPDIVPPEGTTPEAPDASGAAPADTLSNTPLSESAAPAVEPVTATEH
tara:strand:- start:866 stop:1237 length:372 start_codon:yes stop_codon:yes gene_type:complete